MLTHLCLEVDIVKGKQSYITRTVRGCYQNREAGYYVDAIAGKKYSFDYIPVEVRSVFDPYVSITESNYQQPKDNSSLMYVTYILLALGVIFLVAAFVVKPKKEVDQEKNPLR